MVKIFQANNTKLPMKKATLKCLQKTCIKIFILEIASGELKVLYINKVQKLLDENERGTKHSKISQTLTHPSTQSSK